MFIDEVKICVVGGRGGHGRVSFRNVGKSTYKRRPTGGDGGWGGDVYLEAEPRMRTLLSLNRQVHWKAESGAHGGTNSKTGKSGKRLTVKVPVGTVIRDLHTQEILYDLTMPKERVLVARGGLGGRGNEAFLNNRYKSPRISELGEKGEEQWLKLELKMLADVGLIGFPNAGKSTLVAKMSSAKPKVGAYPFTTLEPKIGMVELGYEDFAVVDIPGLIEGAHEGRGLGDRFLKHVERCRFLVHLVDLGNFEGRDPLEDYHKINHELNSFSPILAEKPQLIVGNKTDLIPDEDVQEHIQRFADAGIELMPISAATGAGVQELVKRCAHHLKEFEDELFDTMPYSEEEKVYTLEEDPAPWKIVVDEDGFSVEGPQVRRLGMLRLNTDDAVVYLHDRLESLGVFDALIESGAQAGDAIRIGENEFEFSEEPSPQL